MKKLYIVANWKSHNTLSSATSWIEIMAQQKAALQDLQGKEIIVCPPFLYVSLLQQHIQQEKLPIALGVQNISPFTSGSYTGEVNAEQVHEFATYAIIGHSERRKYFHEDDAILAQKVSMAQQYALIPIFCVEGADVAIPENVAIVAYEPIDAIGTNHPETPENAENVAKTIKEKYSFVQAVLYGGSVTAQNVHDFTALESIDGVLIGGASIDANNFFPLIKNA